MTDYEKWRDDWSHTKKQVNAAILELVAAIEARRALMTETTPTTLADKAITDLYLVKGQLGNAILAIHPYAKEML